MTIGERIRQRRLELGLTQDELAKKMGYKSRAAISNVEKDKVRLPCSALPQSRVVMRFWGFFIRFVVPNLAF